MKDADQRTTTAEFPALHPAGASRGRPEARRRRATRAVSPPAADLRSRLQAALAGRYAIERELGRGGTATVFLAQDLKHKRWVALKVPLRQLAATLGPDRFQREIEIAARLQHPHILTVLDSGEAAGELWFAMPYVEGRSLRDRLTRELQLPVGDAVRIAREAAAALDYAHEHGVIHRDVKPENILLTPRGEVLVADFGIARAFEVDDPLTPSGMAVGTPAYMSPEQSSGGAVDRRTDVYGLGCVLYEMLAGEAPYTGPTAQAIAAKRLSDPVPSVRRLRPSVPPLADQAIRRALAPVPADRFATTAELADALGLSVATPAAITPPFLELPPPPPPPPPVATTATPALPGWAPAPVRQYLRLAGLCLVLGLLVGGALRFAERSPRGASGERTGTTRLAVLPFDNLGDSADAYLADGITDELRGRLAMVPGLEVIAGRSSNEYRHSAKPLPEVARELGVQYLLVGTVRRERDGPGPGRAWVSPELIRVGARGAPTTRFARPFAAPLTDVAQMQADIAGGVARTLGLAPDTVPAAALAARSTTSTDAYDYFLRGNEYYARETIADARLSIQLYQRAVGLDSGFALAWARLARAQAFLFWFGGDRSAAQLARVAEAARTALALAPDLPEAHLAMGYYAYWGHRDYPAALRQFAAAAAREPSNAEAADAIGLVLRRQGEWDRAVASFARAGGLDPRAPGHLLELAQTYFLMRRYPDALHALDRAGALAPDSPEIYAVRMATLLNAEASLDAPRRLMREALGRFEFARFGATHTFGDCLDLVAADDAYRADVARLTPDAFNGATLGYFAFKASVYRRRGEAAKARAYADSARREALSAIRRGEADVFTHTVLAVEDAYLGRASEALEAGRRALAVLPPAKDAVFAPAAHIALAEVHMVLGNTDAALDQLGAALAVPSYLSAGRLRADPLWAPLRGNPRFARLLTGP